MEVMGGKRLFDAWLFTLRSRDDLFVNADFNLRVCIGPQLSFSLAGSSGNTSFCFCILESVRALH
jgi:hypothetical protein